MLERLASGLTGFTRRWVPDPFVLAVLLTLCAFAMALVYVRLDVVRVLVAWMDGAGKDQGFWNLLSFSMQMCLILVTGHALASSPLVGRGLNALADRANTPARAVAIVAAGAMTLGLVNWGLGLIAGALLARRVGQRALHRGIPVHYPLVAAAGYTGMLVWHGGLSASAPLKVTLDKDLINLLGESTARAVGVIPLSQTLGALPNIAGNVVLLILVPWLLIRMIPKDESARQPAPALHDEAALEAAPAGAAKTPADRLERSGWLTAVICVAGIAAWVLAVKARGLGQLDPNLINFLFLFLGLALHGSLLSYGRAILEATRGCAGIILQFPFYAGIMGVLAATGLVASIANAMVQVGPGWLPALSFYSAGLINLFVPSGGGQWAVQGPVLMEAAVRTGLSPARLVMAMAYGDQWTNMLQPFWALPLLGITQVKARDMIGYTAVLLIVSQVVFVAMLYIGW